MSRIRGKLNLAAFKSVVRKMKGKDGKEIDVIIIPIAENKLFLSQKGAVYADIIAFESDKIPDFTHAVKQSFNKEDLSKMKEDNIQTPFIGNFEYISNTTESVQTSDALPESTETSDNSGEDDLPF